MVVGLIPMESFLGPLVPNHLSEFIVGLVLAVLLAVGVQKIVVPKFEKMYEDRAAQIEGGINRAQAVQAEADAAKQKYLAQLASSEDEAAKIRQEAREQASQILAEAKERASQEAARQVESTRAQLESERAQAFQDLKADIGTLATSLAERIVAESLSDNDRASRTIDRFLAELESEPSRQAPNYLPDGLAESR